MPMSVDMVEDQSRRAKGGELGGHLPRDLPASLRSDREPERHADDVVPQCALCIDQFGELRRRQVRSPVHQDEVEADAQARHPPGQANRMPGSRPGYHEACGAEDACAMRELDRLVHLLGEAEIVGRQNQPVQCRAPRRWRNITNGISFTLLIRGTGRSRDPTKADMSAPAK